MKSKRFLVTFCLLQTIIVSAQREKNESEKNIHFHSITQAGFLIGSSDVQLQLATINGIKYKTYFVGAGIGLDYYFERTVPVFIDLRKNILNRYQSPFVYAAAGINIPWIDKDQENWNREYKKGGYYELGLGYNFPLRKSLAVVLSAGYSVKLLSAKEYTWNYFLSSSWPPPSAYINHYQYTLRRIGIKAGVSF